MKITISIIKVALAYFLVSSVLATQLYAAEPYTAFFGNYTGKTDSTVKGDKSSRMVDLSIVEFKKGFQVNWTTTTQKASGKSKKKSYSINFIPTHREKIYSSAMKTNLFGGQIALDPLKGDPYMWARIVDKTMTVYALHVTDDGGYELQVYNRTLTDTGLDLKFSRIRDGQPMRSFKGLLVKK